MYSKDPNTGKVSILLPNLNNRPYLDERIRSIRNQTFQNWELIVMDGYSQDGAWEFFQDCAREDPRLRLYQSAEKGIYTNINRCLKLARGEFIYIATSDDTMAPDALAKLTQALQDNPGCGIAHCKLRIIDRDGNPSPDKTWDNFYVIRYFGDLIDRCHIRKAPHDGLLHYCGITVYTSLTQIMVRKSVFDRIGKFLTDFGSIGDYEWDMRAGMIIDTVHVPEYLATWRFHGDQATGDELILRSKAEGKFLKMSDLALDAASRLSPELKTTYRISEFRFILEQECFSSEMLLTGSFPEKSVRWLRWLFKRPKLALSGYRALLKSAEKSGRSQEEILHKIRALMQEHGLDQNLMKSDT